MRSIRLLFVLLLLGLPLSAQVFVHACAANNASGTTVVDTCAIAAGDAAIAVVSNVTSGTATFTVSDSASQIWTQVGCGYSTKSPDRSSVFWVANSAVLTSVTATISATVSSRIVVLEFSGMAKSSLEDGTCIPNGDVSATSATSSPATFSTLNPNDVLIFGVNADSTANPFTPGSGYTIPTGGIANNGTAVQYQIVSSKQTNISATMTWTTARQWTSTLAAFKGAQHQLPLLGIGPS